VAGFGAAAQPSGSKLPRHGICVGKKRGAAAFAFVVRELCGSNKPWSAAIAFVAREFTPVRLRSSRKACAYGGPEGMGWQGLGLLRSPAGASSLATEFVWVKKRGSCRVRLCGEGIVWVK